MANVQQTGAELPQGAIPSASETLVIVRCFGGIPHVMSLLHVEGGRAFVCRPDEFGEIRSGKRSPPIAGFPLEDVFEFSAREMKRVQAGRKLRWDHLRRLRPSRVAST